MKTLYFIIVCVALMSISPKLYAQLTGSGSYEIGTVKSGVSSKATKQTKSSTTNTKSTKESAPASKSRDVKRNDKKRDNESSSSGTTTGSTSGSTMSSGTTTGSTSGSTMSSGTTTGSTSGNTKSSGPTSGSTMDVYKPSKSLADEVNENNSTTRAVESNSYPASASGQTQNQGNRSLKSIEHRLKEEWSFQPERIDDQTLTGLQLRAIMNISMKEKEAGQTLKIEAYNVLIDKLKTLTQQGVMGEDFSWTDMAELNSQFVDKVFNEIGTARIDLIDAAAMEKYCIPFFYPIVDVTVVSTEDKLMVTIDGINDFSSLTKFTHPFESGRAYTFNFIRNGKKIITKKYMVTSFPKQQLIKQVIPH
ncbi:hypothetical protein GCM10028819_33520 [Spirosoma humi]